MGECAYLRRRGDTRQNFACATSFTGADLGGGCRGCAPSPPRDDLRFSNTTGILQKKKKRSFIGAEVEQETSAPPLKKNPGSAPVLKRLYFGCFRGDLDKILKRS